MKKKSSKITCDYKIAINNSLSLLEALNETKNKEAK